MLPRWAGLSWARMARSCARRPPGAALSRMKRRASIARIGGAARAAPAQLGQRGRHRLDQGVGVATVEGRSVSRGCSAGGGQRPRHRRQPIRLPAGQPDGRRRRCARRTYIPWRRGPLGPFARSASGGPPRRRAGAVLCRCTRTGRISASSSPAVTGTCPPTPATWCPEDDRGGEGPEETPAVRPGRRSAFPPTTWSHRGAGTGQHPRPGDGHRAGGGPGAPARPAGAVPQRGGGHHRAAPGGAARPL